MIAETTWVVSLLHGWFLNTFSDRFSFAIFILLNSTWVQFNILSYYHFNKRIVFQIICLLIRLLGTVSIQEFIEVLSYHNFLSTKSWNMEWNYLVMLRTIQEKLPRTKKKTWINSAAETIFRGSVHGFLQHKFMHGALQRKLTSENGSY